MSTENNQSKSEVLTTSKPAETGTIETSVLNTKKAAFDKAKEVERKAKLAATLAASKKAKESAKRAKLTGVERADDKNTFPVIVKHGKDNFATWYFPEFWKNNLPSFIGSLVTMFSQSFTFFVDFPANKQPLVVPASSGGKGEKERVNKAFADLAKVLFNGLERNTITTDKAKVAILETFRAKGFKFSCFSYVSVSEGIKIKMDNQIQQVAYQKDTTRGIESNKALIVNTNTIKDVRKYYRENGGVKTRLYIKQKNLQNLLPELIES